MGREPLTALQAASAALERRDRSATDLAAYLGKKGFDEAEAREAIDRLAKAGYVSDERLAALRAEQLAGRGHGDEAIRAELVGRHLDRDAIEAAIQLLEPEADRARAVVASEGATSKVARRLSAKGFAEESIESALAGTPG
ncbi:MAG: regulatory protein RecX [Actinomycetes bacterium]